MQMTRIAGILTALLGAALLLIACGGGPLLGDVTLSADTFAPAEANAPLTIAYTVGRDATVDIYVLDASGARYDLRRAQPRVASRDPYVLRFDGTAPTGDPVLVRRLLPPAPTPSSWPLRATPVSARNAVWRSPLLGTKCRCPTSRTLRLRRR